MRTSCKLLFIVFLPNLGFAETLPINCLEVNRGINYKLSYNDDLVSLEHQDKSKSFERIITQSKIQDRYLVSITQVDNPDGTWMFNIFTLDTKDLVIEEGSLDPVGLRQYFVHSSYKCFEPVS